MSESEFLELHLQQLHQKERLTHRLEKIDNEIKQLYESLTVETYIFESNKMNFPDSDAPRENNSRQSHAIRYLQSTLDFLYSERNRLADVIHELQQRIRSTLSSIIYRENHPPSEDEDMPPLEADPSLEAIPSLPTLRRSTRIRHPPSFFTSYAMH